ncbi:MAG TPA: hypothetical protein VKY44_05840 [Flavobacterium sp.]|nr:hypothetical protein [Flavobacterium sp.]
MKKILFMAFLSVFALNVQAQSLTNTEIVQVKGIYDFQTEFNEYRVNSFLKYQLEEAGFQVYYDTQEMPAEVKADPCKELKCIVTRDKSMLATKLNIKLINCKGDVVFTADGESRLKVRDKSHVDAIKDALEYSALKNLRK